LRNALTLAVLAALPLLLLSAPARADEPMDAIKLADPQAAGFGVDQYFIGAQVDAATLEGLGFTLDDYYAPDTYYSKPVDVKFDYGVEQGRMDIGVDKGEIYSIVFEFNNVWPSKDGQTLDSRQNMEQLLQAVAALLDSKYNGWQSEQWAHEDDVLHVDIMDLYNDQFALSFRISPLANTLIFTSAADRQTKDDPWGSDEDSKSAEPAPDATVKSS